MDTIHAPLSVSISELKRNPTAVIEQAQGQSVVILNHNKPTAYIVTVEAYEAMTKQYKKGLASSIGKRFADLHDITQDFELPSRNDETRAIEL